jgi:hypothetical protein
MLQRRQRRQWRQWRQRQQQATNRVRALTRVQCGVGVRRDMRTDFHGCSYRCCHVVQHLTCMSSAPVQASYGADNADTQIEPVTAGTHRRRPTRSASCRKGGWRWQTAGTDAGRRRRRPRRQAATLHSINSSSGSGSGSGAKLLWPHGWTVGHCKRHTTMDPPAPTHM